MAGGRVPGPSGISDEIAQIAGAVFWSLCNEGSCRNGSLPGPAGAHAHRPITVADAGKGKSKTTAKAADKPKINTIYLHFYLPVTVKGDKPGKKAFSKEDFYAWLNGKTEDFADVNGTPQYQQGHWEDLGIKLELKKDYANGVAEFKNSLQQPNSIVVYLGHSTLDKNNSYHSMGLTPKGNSVPEIPSKELRTLLTQSKASLVVLCSCDSLTAAGTLSGGPIVIATDSGPDRETNTVDWANALGAFLFALIGLDLDRSRQPNNLRKGGHATVTDALETANKEFADSKTGDSFKRVYGDASVVLIP